MSRKKIQVVVNGKLEFLNKDDVKEAMENLSKEEIQDKNDIEIKEDKRLDLPLYQYQKDLDIVTLKEGYIINGNFYTPDEIKTGLTINKIFYSSSELQKKFISKKQEYRSKSKIDNFLSDLSKPTISIQDEFESNNFKHYKENNEKNSMENSLLRLNAKNSGYSDSIGRTVITSLTLDIENDLWNLDNLFKEFIKIDPDLRFSRVSRFPIKGLDVKFSKEPFYPYLSVEWVIYNLNKLHIDNSGFNKLFKENFLLEESEDLTIQTYSDMTLEESLSKFLFQNTYNKYIDGLFYKDITIVINTDNGLNQISKRFYLNTGKIDNRKIYSLSLPLNITHMDIYHHDIDLQDEINRFILNDVRVNTILNYFDKISIYFLNIFNMYKNNILSFDFERGVIMVEIKQDINSFRYQEACNLKDQIERYDKDVRC